MGIYHQNINGQLLSVSRIAEIYGIENAQEDCTCALSQVVWGITAVLMRP
ncbi:MAG: hypothetical protein V7782_10110 [Psychromonas sp.]